MWETQSKSGFVYSRTSNGGGGCSAGQRLFTHISDTGRPLACPHGQTLRNQCRGDDEEAEDVSGLSNQNEKWRYINISVLGNCIGQTEFRRRCKFLPQQLCPSPDHHFVNLAGALDVGRIATVFTTIVKTFQQVKPRKSFLAFLFSLLVD